MSVLVRFKFQNSLCECHAHTNSNFRPYYNGGYPMNSLHWDSEEEEYSCATTVSVGASDGYCQTWTSFEESPDEWEEGKCNCTEVSQSGNYCGKWHCEQDEYDKCAKGEGCNDCDPDGTSNISKLNNQESRIHNHQKKYRMSVLLQLLWLRQRWLLLFV